MLAVAALSLMAACGGGQGSSGALAGFSPGATPPEWSRGAALFGSYCAACHGAFGTGQGLGPPLLDSLYLAPASDDAALTRAVAQGARQQHWNYGAMPPVERVAPAELPALTGYIRWVQRRWLETSGRLPGAS
jgi:mono/diheme cytochrome c family protein